MDMMRRIVPLAAGLLLTGLLASSALAADINLLNVSYDPTRELYAEFNKAFANAYQKETGKSVEIKQSHGGTGSQARAVIDGLQADVVTLALAYDIDAIAEQGPHRDRLAEASAAEFIALHLDHRVPGAQGQSEGHQGLGRSGQARRRGDHAEPEDLRRGALELSRGLGLCAEEIRLRADKAKDFVGKLYQHVPVLDTGARGSTVTFVERGVGDVLLAWENEAYLALKEFGPDKFEIVAPSQSILAEPPVAVVDKVVDKKGTRNAAEAYLQYLYTHGRPGDRRAQFLPSARSPRSPRNTKTPSPRSSCSRSTTFSAAGPRRRRNISPTAASSTRSTRTDRAPSSGAFAGGLVSAVAARRRSLPGFGLTLGLTLSCLSVIVLIPLAGAVPEIARAEPRAVLEHPVQPPRAERACASPSASPCGGLRQSRSSAASSPGCWCATASPGTRLFDAIVDLPFALPTAVAGIALTALYAEKGWLGALLAALGIKVAYTPLGIFVALIFIGLPFVVRTVQPVLAGSRPRGRGGRRAASAPAAGRPSAA